MWEFGNVIMGVSLMRCVRWYVQDRELRKTETRSSTNATFVLVGLRGKYACETLFGGFDEAIEDFLDHSVDNLVRVLGELVRDAVGNEGVHADNLVT